MKTQKKRREKKKLTKSIAVQNENKLVDTEWIESNE